MNRNFIIKIGGALNPSVKKSFTKASKELEKLGLEMKQMKTRSKALGKARQESSKLENQFIKSRAEFQKNSKESEILADKIEKLKIQVNGSGKASKAATIEFKKALQTQKQLDKTLVKSKESTKKYSNELSKAKSRVWMLSKGEKELGDKMQRNLKIQEKMRKSQKRFKDYKDNGQKRMKKMIPPALMIGVGVKLAIDDEAAFADVKKQLSISDPKEIQKFRKELLQTTKDIPLMNTEIYEIAAAAGQAGIEQKELAKFTADTAKVAVAFGVDADKAGGNLATWRTSLKMTQTEVMGLADQINTLGDNIKVTPAQVSDIVTAMGPLGKMANITVSETAALGASLIDFGVKDASTASTALRKLYSTMSSGESASKSRKEAFEALGFDSGQIAKDMQKDSMGTIKKVLGAFENVDKSKRMSIGTMLFGEEAVGALLPLTNQLGKLQNNLDMINDKKKVANSVNNEFNNVNGTASAQLKILGKSLLNLGLAFTNFLLPPLKVLTKLFTKGSQIITGFAQKFPGLTEFLTLTATGFVGVNLAIGAATFGVGALGTAFTALMSNPILLILAAVAAGGYLIYKNFDKIESKTIELWNGFKTNIGKMKDKTLELWEVFEKSPIFKVFEYSPLGMFLKGIKRIYDWYKKFKGEKTKELPSLQKVKTSNLLQNRNTKQLKSPSKSALSGSWDRKQNINNIPAYAKGGTVNTPHLALVGDAPETIVPHDGTRQSKSLWYHAGAKLGMFAGDGIPSLTSKVEKKLINNSTDKKIEIKIDFNPTIQGNVDNLSEILKKSSEDLAQIIKKIVKDTIAEEAKFERRLSFD